MSYCSSCGNKIATEMLFCPQCGSKVIPSLAADTTSNNADESTIDMEVHNHAATLSQGQKKSKLYKQWVKYADLPTEEISPVKTPGTVPVREENNARPSRLMYILFAVGVLLCVGLAILLIRIW